MSAVVQGHRKINQKIFIKRGEIESLDRPGSTMLLLGKEGAMPDMVKPGDKVKLKVQTLDDAIVVT